MQNDNKTETRPEILNGQTIKVRSPFGTMFVTINTNGDNQPFELFLNVGKCGSDVCADAEAIGRLCSLLLRIPSPVPEEKRIELIVNSLTGIGGNGDVLFGAKRIRSLPDAVAYALNQYAETHAEMHEAACANDSPSDRHAA
jgi:ribonucleoside-diphosphate reductase alpha chain